MLDILQGLHPVLQALLATCFTWAMTAAGAAVVFAAKDISQRVLDTMLGFAAGVMIAVSYWSLLAPAIEMSKGKSIPSWVPAVTGFLIGGIFLWGIDKVLPHLHTGFRTETAEGVKTTWRRSTLLILAITLHNIPEGLAVGVAFGALAAGLPAATLGTAIALAIGIGIQNFPEGLAVSLPLRREGWSRRKSFWYGQLSAVVEPIFGVIGAAAVIVARPVLPYALAFAAGAMIFVVIEELVPEAQRSGNRDLATMGGIVGFAMMMLLDVAFSQPAFDRMKIFTAKELKKYDGKNRLAQIACGGKVYDVSTSYHWRNGMHHATHQAGCDLTEALRQAPHGHDLLDKFPIVGEFVTQRAGYTVDRIKALEVALGQQLAFSLEPL